MPKIIIYFFICIFPCFLLAQKAATQDIIYLKNGSIIHGKITEEKEKEFVKIQVSATNELFFPMDEVKSITHHATVLAEDECPKKSIPIHYKSKGIYVNVFGSHGFGGGAHGDRWMTNTNVIVGYMFNRHIGVGIGTGSYWYHASGRLAPFYVEARGEFLKQKRCVPIYYGRLGYATVIGTSGITQELKAGLFWNLGIGYKEYTTRKHQWTYTVGLQSQATYQKWQEQNWGEPVRTYEGYITLKRIVWSWGIMF